MLIASVTELNPLHSRVTWKLFPILVGQSNVRSVQRKLIMVKWSVFKLKGIIKYHLKEIKRLESAITLIGSSK